MGTKIDYALVLGIDDDYVHVKFLNGGYESFKQDLFPTPIKEDDILPVIMTTEIPPQILKILERISFCERMYIRDSRNIKKLEERVGRLEEASKRVAINKRKELKVQVASFKKNQIITEKIVKKCIFRLCAET